MARKSKRMALNEAIRQGQAKIVESMKTGQISPSVSPAQRTEEGKKAPLHPESAVSSFAKCRTVSLKSKEKPVIWGQLPPKTKLIALFGIASVIAVALGLWLVSLIGTNQSPQAESPGTPVSGVVSEENEQAQKKFRLPGFGSDDSSDSVDSATSEKVSLSPPSEGANVIWIQSIALNRKNELAPIAEFFKRKGIETEIIVHRVSGDAILVTKAGFEQNPANKGTQGYELLQRIKQFGTVYVEETKDTRFGAKPFQDELGYKR